MDLKIKAIEDALAVQLSPGNWNVDPYMHGMTNGLIFALSILREEEPSYKSAPDQWLDAQKTIQGIIDKGVDTNVISDGYHTFGELYDHRITTFIALCRVYQRIQPDYRAWRSKKHSDGELAFGGTWFVLGIGSLKGEQITYHLPMERWEETNFAEELEKAPEFDGHTSADVLERLKSL